MDPNPDPNLDPTYNTNKDTHRVKVFIRQDIGSDYETKRLAACQLTADTHMHSCCLKLSAAAGHGGGGTPQLLAVCLTSGCLMASG